ncbi:hypothetical protein ACFYZJ_37690 [Streptomyces sp. NPDC001848]|uniref:hypothetical protein n=1 Tax=Streptomyces sp. NPDC001848 TaxID=3364618 RepID=UPI00367AE5F2
MNQRLATQLVAIARRAAAREPQPVKIPRRGRPRIILTVDRSGAEQPPPGTVTTPGDGHLVLYVGRWVGAPGQGSPLADQLRAARLLEIVCATQVGAEFARRQLNIGWRMDDVEASGLLRSDAFTRMRNGRG